VRHNRLFAVGLAAALMLGAASPALAAGKAKGKATAPGQAKPKPTKPEKQKPAKKAKKTKAGVSGGGTITTLAGPAEFSIQARLRDITGDAPSTGKGHFNYTSADGTVKIRCRGFDKFAPTGNVAVVPFNNCTVSGQPTVTEIDVTVTDNGDPEAIPPVADVIDFTAGAVDVVDAPLTSGNIKVRQA
jgi:hypothetical protein